MKKLSLTFLAIVGMLFFTLCTSTIMAQVTAINPNGGFEDFPLGQAAPDTTLGGWSFYSASPAVAYFEILGDGASSGYCFLSVTVTALGSNDWDIQAVNEPTYVSSNTRYLYSIWAKSDTSGPALNFTVGLPVTYTERLRMGSVALTQDWKKYWTFFTTGATDTSVRAPIHFALKANSTFMPIAFYIDDLQIAKVPVIPRHHPVTPVLASPDSAATLQGTAVTMTWQSGGDTCIYQCQLSTDPTFSSYVVNDSTVIGTSMQAKLSDKTQYYWRVRGWNRDSVGQFSSVFTFKTGTTGVKRLGGSPTSYALSQNYPNPFNPSTTIRYDIPKNAYVKVTVYDILGRAVATLVDGLQTANRYSVEWNPSGLSSGIYFCRIQARSVDGSINFASVKKLVYMK